MNFALKNDNALRTPKTYKVSVTATITYECEGIDEDAACARAEKALLGDLQVSFGKRNVTVDQSVVMG